MVDRLLRSTALSGGPAAGDCGLESLPFCDLVLVLMAGVAVEAVEVVGAAAAVVAGVEAAVWLDCDMAAGCVGG